MDYNLNVINSKNQELKNLSESSIKEYIRKMFNNVLNDNGWADCQDSTSCLTTEKRHFTQGNKTEFSIDLAIVHENPDGTWYRLIHEKTRIVSNDRWYWNEAPHSKGLKKKVDKLKSNNYWEEVGFIVNSIILNFTGFSRLFLITCTNFYVIENNKISECSRIIQ